MSNLDNLFSQRLNLLQERLQQETGARLSVAFQDIQSNEKYGVNASRPGWAASMIKVPVLISVFRSIDDGKLSFDEEVAIDHRYTLDSTSEISYRQQGSTAPVSELVNYMILASCNESTNMLAARVGIPYINSLMRQLGCPNTAMSHLLHVGATLEDPGIDGTSSNTTTAEEMTALMGGIYRNTVASVQSCEYMRKILENDSSLEYGGASVNHYLNRALPAGTRIGAKCGILEEDVMETAVINGDYALTVMFNKVPASFFGEASRLLSLISGVIFERYYLNEDHNEETQNQKESPRRLEGVEQ